MAHGLSCSGACRVLPDQGSNPCPHALAGGFLATGPPEKPISFDFEVKWDYVCESALKSTEASILKHWGVINEIGKIL